VALVHGFASSFDHGWARYGWPDLLADAGRDVLGVELLGHGANPRPHDPSAYDALTRHAAAQLPPSPVDVVAFSLGALTSLRIASQDPQRFERIAVLGIGDRAFEQADGSALADVVAGAAPGPENAGDQMVFHRLARQQGNDPEALAALLRHPQPPLELSLLAEVRCPVLVVIGDQDPAYPADHLAAAFPSGELFVARGVDHFSTPADFTVIERVLDFLDR
jgi:pimeloyl-ACP methyl ester carboxylesterase